MSTAIIFNRLNMESVLAAAILKREFPEAETHDILRLVNTDAEKYIWVGVNPKQAFAGFYKESKNKEHVIIERKETNEEATLTWFQRINPWHVSNDDNSVNNDHAGVKVQRTLIIEICEKFGFTNEDYLKLDFHTAHFYDRKSDIEYLTYVYINVKAAEQSLNDGTKFDILSITLQDTVTYMNDMQRLKRNFESQYTHAFVCDGDKVKKVIKTTISSFDIHLALRIAKLSHVNFVNIAMGMSGAVIFSNLRNLKVDSYGKEAALLN